jgi:hypothetical protein
MSARAILLSATLGGTVALAGPPSPARVSQAPASQAVAAQAVVAQASVSEATSSPAVADPPPQGARGDRPEDWIQLWNGRDLSGFVPKIRGYAVGENFGNTFRVENGVLKVSYEAYDTFDDRFGHLFYERPFSHYILVAEYRFVGAQVKGGPDWAYRNSGLMIHGQAVSTMKKDQDFPISIEVQLLGGREKGERTTANLCTPGTHVEREGKLVTEHCVSSRSKTCRGDGWVRVEVEVHGSERIVHRVNGETVLRYERPQIGGGEVSGHDPAAKKDGVLLEEGSISLQSESHSIEFRKVELLNLVGCADPRARNHRPYVAKADPAACAYP